MAITFVANYKVKDFEIRKDKFGSNSDARKPAVIKDSPNKKGDDPLVVYIIDETPSKQVLEGTLATPKIRQLMKATGVICKPSMAFPNR